MAIQTVQDMTVNPETTTLPRRIHFKHFLRSDIAPEKISVTYTITNPDTEIRFQDNDGSLNTTKKREDTVIDEKLEYEDRLKMVGQPAGDLEVVEILATITDSDGETIPESVSVRVNRF